MKRLAAAAAAIAAAASARADPLPFSPGERIEMAIEWLAIRAGRASIEVGQPDGSIWPVVLNGRTEGVASLVDVREHVVSLWDAEARVSRGIDLDAVEIGYRHSDQSRFDRETGKATVVSRGKSRTEKVIDVPADAHDLLSAVLWLRFQPLRDGDHHELPVLAGEKTFTLVADVVGREEVGTPAGVFPAAKVRVRTALDGQFRSRRDTFLWFSDDARHVPVRASAQLVLGSLVAELVSYRAGGALAEAQPHR